MKGFLHLFLLPVGSIYTTLVYTHCWPLSGHAKHLSDTNSVLLGTGNSILVA